MSYELIYTSSPRGLRAGAAGYCTVAATSGIPTALADRLERLGVAREARSEGNDRIGWSHLTVSAGGRTWNVVSRMAPAGLDYTDRPRRLAHHRVVLPEERPAGGPAWLLGRTELFPPTWDGIIGELALKPLPTGDRPPARCLAWEEATGDAGWAGVLVRAFLADSRRRAYVIVTPGTDLLELFAEAIALVPRERRWDATFQTDFAGLPPDVGCLWRGVLAGSEEARQTAALPGALVLDLSRPLGPAPGPVEFARTGILPASPAAATGAHSSAPDRSPYALGDPGLKLAVDDSSLPPPLPRASRKRPKAGGMSSSRARTWVAMGLALLLMVAVAAALQFADDIRKMFRSSPVAPSSETQVAVADPPAAAKPVSKVEAPPIAKNDAEPEETSRLVAPPSDRDRNRRPQLDPVQVEATPPADPKVPAFEIDISSPIKSSFGPTGVRIVHDEREQYRGDSVRLKSMGLEFKRDIVFSEGEMPGQYFFRVHKPGTESQDLATLICQAGRLSFEWAQLKPSYDDYVNAIQNSVLIVESDRMARAYVVLKPTFRKYPSMGPRDIRQFDGADVKSLRLSRMRLTYQPRGKTERAEKFMFADDLRDRDGARDPKPFARFQVPIGYLGNGRLITQVVNLRLDQERGRLETNSVEGNLRTENLLAATSPRVDVVLARRYGDIDVDVVWVGDWEDAPPKLLVKAEHLDKSATAKKAAPKQRPGK